MRKDLNRVQLIGHLGGNPELRSLESGTTVATFSVATNRSWQDANGQPQTETEWSRVVAWGRLAEIAGEYLHKGRQVFIAGRLHTRHWQDQDGQTRYMTEVVAEDLIMLDSRPTDAAPISAPPAPALEPPPAAGASAPKASARPIPPAQRQPPAAARQPASGVQPRPRGVRPPQHPPPEQADDAEISF